MDNPVGPESWWWDNAWWEEGQIPVPGNHKVETRWIEYPNDDISVPAMVAYPADGGKYPAVLYQHGRRGLDELIQAQVKRLAARGFVVLAPDVFSGRFIEKMPIEHDYDVETDVAAGVGVFVYQWGSWMDAGSADGHGSAAAGAQDLSRRGSARPGSE